LGTPRSTSAEDLPPVEGRRHEVLGIVTGALTVLLGLALWSYDARGGENWIGPVGRAMAGTLATAFGVGAWVLPFELGLATVRLFSRKPSILGLATMASTFVFVVVGCAMLHLGLSEHVVFGGHQPGGLLGEVLGEVLRSLLGLAGAFVVGISVLLITLVLRTPLSLADGLQRALFGARSATSASARGVGALWEAWREAKALEREEREAERRAAEPKIIGDDDEELDGSPAEDEDDQEAVAFEDEPGIAFDVDEDDAEEQAAAPKSTGGKAAGGKAAGGKAAGGKAAGGKSAAANSAGGNSKASSPPQSPSSAGKRAPTDNAAPKIVAPSPEAKRVPPKSSELPSPVARSPDGSFVLPPPTLLDEAPEGEIHLDAETLKANAARLVDKLAAYGVKGRVDEIHPGPVVTMYEFEPQSGTKISKIAGLADDLAMALAAQKVRIVAPIPGKARVGFELPNDHRLTVHLREVLEDDRWQKAKGALPIALGKDIAGQPVYGDLAKMPHLLVAGATGSGKSVGLNVILASLLSKKTPEEVRLLMIDPKVVELAVFDGIPHMLLPVVTDMKKAALALKWAVDEMERRYQLFADAGARSIGTYNEKVDKVLRGELAPEKLKRKKAAEKFAAPEDGSEVPEEKPPERLPHVVVVVDEFADLMMVAAKDVEACIARLAQKARAAGIHVILATQRPSVDVITGMIKANFPARIAFKVSQREDSKTILGRNGAEHLLGMGDMLMIPPGSSDLRRVHSAYISEEEVREVCEFLREQGTPVYDEDILKPREDGDDGLGGGQSSDDPVYDKAVAVVAQAGYCSISHIQRQLSVGYNKAAKLVERMEQEGVVGPPSGKAGGRREVLVQPA
jgi:S-DNA-T family DNA segregation ATPase FtsK/SpoIIIE